MQWAKYFSAYHHVKEKIDLSAKRNGSKNLYFTKLLKTMESKTY